MDKSLIIDENDYNFEILEHSFSRVLIKSIINEIEKIKNNNINLFFIEAESIPETLLKKILDISKYKNITIYTHSTNLYSYLYNLSLKVNLLKDTFITIEDNIIKSQSKSQINALLILASIENIDYIIYLLKKLKTIQKPIFIVDDNLNPQIYTYLKKNLKNHFINDIKDNIILENHQIYIISENVSININNDKISFIKDSNDNKSSILKNLYDYYEQNLAVIVLSNHYLITSFMQNKYYDYKIIIQAPIESEKNKQVLKILQSDYYDYVMPIYEIKEYIKRHINNSNELKIDEINYFLEKVKSTYGYNYLNYSEDILLRVIKKNMINSKITDFDQFQTFILENKENFKSLFLNLSINFTEFFRDNDIYKYISEKVFDYLKSSQNIKIWCAGCSTGEEVYSLSILLDEFDLLKKSHIYATDINQLVIEQAKNGIFSKNKIEENNANYINAGGKKNFKDYFIYLNNCYQVKDYIREKIIFFEHSLLSKGVINEFDMIFCRNVLIYFNKSLFNETVDLLYKSLKNNGFLVLGKNEDLITNHNFIVYNDSYKIYKKHFSKG